MRLQPQKMPNPILYLKHKGQYLLYDFHDNMVFYLFVDIHHSIFPYQSQDQSHNYHSMAHCPPEQNHNEDMFSYHHHFQDILTLLCKNSPASLSREMNCTFKRVVVFLEFFCKIKKNMPYYFPNALR